VIRINIEQKKRRIVRRYGVAPTICYFYYLWNAVDYAGEEMVRKSFESIRGQGNEIIVGDYGSTDETVNIAKEYGFKVIDVEKTPDILFHDSKIANKIIKESKSNFLVDLNIHVEYTKNMDEFFKSWISANNVKRKCLVARGLFQRPDGKLVRKYTASCLFYRPYLLEARGIDERTYYGKGTTHYTLCLLLNVYKLIFDNIPLDIVHKYHTQIKTSIWRNVFKFGNSKSIGRKHKQNMVFAERVISSLEKNFDRHVNRVRNSYW